jgi:uncharacterized membrane protein YhhN
VGGGLGKNCLTKISDLSWSDVAAMLEGDEYSGRLSFPVCLYHLMKSQMVLEVAFSSQLFAQVVFACLTFALKEALAFT